MGTPSSIIGRNLPMSAIGPKRTSGGPKAKGPAVRSGAVSPGCLLGAFMVAIFTSEGLMLADGHRSSRSGNERKGDHNKSEDFSHTHISSTASSILLVGPHNQQTFA